MSGYSAFYTDEFMREHQEVLDILAMSDEEVLAECRAEGRDPEQIAIEMRAIFEEAKLIADEFIELRAQKDSAYAERDKCLVLMALMAQRLGLKVGIGIDPAESDPDWNHVLFIDLPAGQVSWHIPTSETSWFYFVGAYDGAWDEHTTEEKYRRVMEPGI